ncbi:hypothetical protein AX14_002353 [Amanita brunnescens Koide BX004]|nr:hypothetical protein AX14_002353 [Amanita brunnescens Koide BX004]
MPNPRWPSPLRTPQTFNGSFNGTFLATTPAPSCIQSGLPGSSFIERGPQPEDCLLLDVFVPSNDTNSSSLPVKVWLYGGSNESGGASDPLYNGCNLATDAILSQ